MSKTSTNATNTTFQNGETLSPDELIIANAFVSSIHKIEGFAIQFEEDLSDKRLSNQEIFQLLWGAPSLTQGISEIIPTVKAWKRLPADREAAVIEIVADAIGDTAEGTQSRVHAVVDLAVVLTESLVKVQAKAKAVGTAFKRAKKQAAQG